VKGAKKKTKVTRGHEESRARVPTLLVLDCMHLSPLPTWGPHAAPQLQVAIAVLDLEPSEI
jgi:hypothetical protein